jgi:ABC-2 type transport system permease protein
MRLVLVELRRLFARRFFTVGLATVLIGAAAFLAITAWQSAVPTERDWAAARAAAAADAPALLAERDRCLESQRTGVGETIYPPDYRCADITRPRLESYLAARPYIFADQIGDQLFALSSILILFGFLLGATVIGAEWHHGTLTGLLLWEPRRVRVFAAKLVALLTGVTLVGALAYAAIYGGSWGVARLRGIVGTLSPELHTRYALDAGRGLALALVGAAVGFAISFTLKHTAAAIGVVFAYFSVFELGVRSFVPSSPQWLATTYITAWLERHAEVTYSNCLTGGCGVTHLSVPMWAGGAYVLGIAVAALVAAAVVFRRREVA